MSNNKASTSTKILVGIICSAAVLIPAFVLTYRHATNAAFALLTVLGLIVTVLNVNGTRDNLPAVLRATWWPLLAMALLPLVIALNQFMSNHVLPNVPYVYTRFGMCALLVMSLLLVPSRFLTQSYWGFILGAFISAFVAYSATRVGRPGDIATVNPIPYGNLCIALGIISLLVIVLLRAQIQARFGRVGIVVLSFIALAATTAGLLGSYWTQSRGGWLALVITVPLLIVFFTQFRFALKTLFLFVFALALGGSYMLSPQIQARVADAVTQYQSFETQGNKDTSVGIRLQLWQASAQELADHPLLGVGLDRYSKELVRLKEAGSLTAIASTMPHSHNELAFYGMTLGVPGLLAILALYFVPCIWFTRLLHHPDHVVSTVALMGITTCLLFFVFGWTEVMFVIAATNALYTFLIALFIATIVKREQELELN